VPHTAQKLHEYLGYDGQLFDTQHVVEYQEETRSHRALTYDHTGAIGTWTASELPAGQALRKPAPLFKKLDESVVERSTRGWKNESEDHKRAEARSSALFVWFSCHHSDQLIEAIHW
jgi:hypothetical protein